MESPPCDADGQVLVRLRDATAALEAAVSNALRSSEGDRLGLQDAPLSFLRHASPEMAARLLRESDRSLADIAPTTGFGGQGHLTTAFRLAKGVTPGRHRRGLALQRVEQRRSREARP